MNIYLGLTAGVLAFWLALGASAESTDTTPERGSGRRGVPGVGEPMKVSLHTKHNLPPICINWEALLIPLPFGLYLWIEES